MIWLIEPVRGLRRFQADPGELLRCRVPTAPSASAGLTPHPVDLLQICGFTLLSLAPGGQGISNVEFEDKGATIGTKPSAC